MVPGAYTRTMVHRGVASFAGGEAAADEAVASSIAEGSEALYSQIENRPREHILSIRYPTAREKIKNGARRPVSPPSRSSSLVPSAMATTVQGYRLVGVTENVTGIVL